MVISRTQSLVLGFFVLAWISLLVILLVDPEIYDGATLAHDPSLARS